MTDPGSESDWDLDLALTTVEFNKAKLERIRQMGTRCAFLVTHALSGATHNRFSVLVCVYFVGFLKERSALGSDFLSVELLLGLMYWSLHPRHRWVAAWWVVCGAACWTRKNKKRMAV